MNSIQLNHSASIEKTTAEPYDYIICGGGTAGCVLAERLTADGTKRVLMLEAGRADYDNLFIRIPAGILRLFRSVYDWQHESSGEKHCNGRNVFLQRGKVSCEFVLQFYYYHYSLFFIGCLLCFVVGRDSTPAIYYHVC